MTTFDRLQEAYDYRTPPEDDIPEVPEHLILQVCHEWAENPPDWMREKAVAHYEAIWIEKRKNQNVRSAD